jgi:hypothetical protein
MSYLDTLHLFTIPDWLPDLPSEIWAIIFYWKWRYEMKDIQHQMLNIMTLTPRLTTSKTEFCSFSNTWWESGNTWWFTYHCISNSQSKMNDEWGGCRDRDNYNTVEPRCGIKLGKYSYYYNKETLYKHITEDLNIICSNDATWIEMIRLCRTV